MRKQSTLWGRRTPNSRIRRLIDGLSRSNSVLVDYIEEKRHANTSN